MDTRDTPEQSELRRTARRLAGELGPRSVADLDDEKRRERLAEAVRDAGWLELRSDAGGGEPLAGGVEAAIIAAALAEALADVPFAGPVLAADLARRAGGGGDGAFVVGFSADLRGVAVVAGDATEAPIHAVDAVAEGPIRALVLRSDGDGFRLARVEAEAAREGADLTRHVATLPAGLPVRPVSDARLTRDDLAAWRSLGLALTSADLVGGMRGVLDATVAYAQERKQYGVAIGSFQAVQHLLAEARCLVEGAFSASLYPAWGVDELPPEAACAAGRVAKAYAARAARTVCETAIQVYGGMGNTWDCLAHVYLRRALLSSHWFGDESEQLRQISRARHGVTDGLP